MNIAIKQKYLKYLFWLGPILLIVGLSAAAVSGIWVPLPLALVIAGVVISAGWLFFEASFFKSFLGRRSTQAGTNALAATVAVLVILGLINFLGVRYAKQIDLTENQLFTLSPQTQEVLQDLDQPVKVWVFSATPNQSDRRLLENYQRQSDQFSFEYVDPNAQPGRAREFGVQQGGEVYLEKGEDRELLQQVTQEPLSERRITNGILQIANDSPLKVYFLQGHGERSPEPGQGSFAQALANLTEAKYVAEPLNLAESAEIPEDTAVLILAGPQRELLEAEVTALESYLQRKGGLLLLLDPDTDPGLGELLQDWGVALDDRLIIDPSGQVAGANAAVTIVTQYGVHPITEEFGDGISFYPLARPVGVSESPDVEASPLLLTGDRVQAQPIPENGDLNFDPNLPPQGSLTLGVALSRPATEVDAPDTPPDTPQSEASPSPDAASPSPEATDQAEEAESDTSDEAAEAPETRLIVIGNSSFATDGLFDQQLNGDVFLNSVSWLSQQDSQVLSIRPREVTNRRIVMTPQKQLLSGLTALLILPVLGFGTALIVWLRRR